MLTFLRVVETGSFSKAASELGMTQPTATKAVAEAERRLGVRLLHRTTRGVTPTELGSLYYERCKIVVHHFSEAEQLASEGVGLIGGSLRVNTSVAFGRRVMAPLVLRYMREHRGLHIDLSLDDRYVNLVEQGVDVAIRMGRLADSTLGASYLGVNPWVLVASPSYLSRRGTPSKPSDLDDHECLVYSSVQGDARWLFHRSSEGDVSVPVRGPLRSNNLSTVLAACEDDLGLALLPRYVARESIRSGRVHALMTDYTLPIQEVHAVFSSPKQLPQKVSTFVRWLQAQLQGDWWERPW